MPGPLVNAGGGVVGQISLGSWSQVSKTVHVQPCVLFMFNFSPPQASQLDSHLRGPKCLETRFFPDCAVAQLKVGIMIEVFVGSCRSAFRALSCRNLCFETCHVCDVAREGHVHARTVYQRAFRSAERRRVEEPATE